MKVIEMRPPRIGMGLFALAFVFHLILPAWNNVKLISPSFGVLIIILGFSIMIWAWLLFRKNDVAICPTAQTERLIFDGLFSFSRNPMYLGMVSICVGLAILFGSLSLYIATIIYFSILNFVFIPYEEQKLERTFGADYTRYKKTVRRWL